MAEINCPRMEAHARACRHQRRESRIALQQSHTHLHSGGVQGGPQLLSRGRQLRHLGVSCGAGRRRLVALRLNGGARLSQLDARSLRLFQLAVSMVGLQAGCSKGAGGG